MARTVTLAAALLLTPYYILVVLGAGLLVLELATSAIVAPRVAMDTKGNARRLFFIRAVFGWLGPWPTARLKRERLRHGLIHLLTSAGLAAAVLHNDAVLGDGTVYQVVAGTVGGALGVQLVGWALFLHMPGDDDCTVF